MAHAKSKIAFRIYRWAWGAAIPILRLNQRVSEGFSQRTLDTPLPQADIWIQAASGGEAYLARSIIRRLQIPSFTRILLTTNTRQGLEILEKAVDENAHKNTISLYTAYFLVYKSDPFPAPAGMNRSS